MQNMSNVLDPEFDDFDDNALMYKREVTEHEGALEELPLANECQEQLYNYWISIDTEKYIDKLNTTEKTIK